jgi:hypothetical protein
LERKVSGFDVQQLELFKSQIPNPKQITMSEIQNPKQLAFEFI